VDNSIGRVKLGNGFSTDVSGIINISGFLVSNTATDTTLGGFKIDASSNLIITNDTLDVKLPLIYTDALGSGFSTLLTTNSTSDSSIHSYTFYKPANCIINSYWSGRYFVTGSGSDVFQLRFKVQCSGITDQYSEYHIQKWGGINSSPTLSSVSYNTDLATVKSYSGNVTVNVYVKKTLGSDTFTLYTSHLKILLYN
jgi:hypothetical protein